MRSLPHDQWIQCAENMDKRNICVRDTWQSRVRNLVQAYHRHVENGKIWNLNEEGKYLKETKSEDDYQQIARRFGRYKRARIEAPGQIKKENETKGLSDTYIGWQEVRNKVLKNRERSGYNSEQGEKQYQEKREQAGRKDKVAREAARVAKDSRGSNARQEVNKRNKQMPDGKHGIPGKQFGNRLRLDTKENSTIK